MHLAAVVARQAGLAGIAQGVFVAVHQRVHGGIKRVVAQKAQRIRAANGLLFLVKHIKRFLERGQKLGGFRRMHGVAQFVVLGDAQACHGVEQRVGALVSQQERVGFVARAADGLEQAIVDVAAEEIVGDDRRHSVSPFLVCLTFILRG